MARKSKSMKSPSKEALVPPSMKGSMPEMMKMTPEQKNREEQYQLEDDARTVNNYLKLRKDSPRHAKTLTFMRQQVADLNSLGGKNDAMPRKAKRITARKGGRGSSRR
jgi:hypothetical protein